MAKGDFILKIDGIKGESEIDGHKGEIEVEGFSWGVSQSGQSHTSTGSGSGQAHLNDISFTKFFDKSSTALSLACCTGRHIDNAKLFARKAGGDNAQVDYLVMEFKNLIVSSYQLSGHSGSGVASESFSLNFAEVAMDYKKQDAKGKGTSEGNMRYNQSEQKKK